PLRQFHCCHASFSRRVSALPASRAASQVAVEVCRSRAFTSSSSAEVSALKGKEDASSASSFKRVILTFSGKVRASSGSEIWSRVAQVMSAAGANIETAGGTFVPMELGSEEAESESFSVSAFGACISPSILPADGLREEPLLGCTMFLKAVLPNERVSDLMQLLRTQSPLQVYTISLSSDAVPCSATDSCPERDLQTGEAGDRETGTLYLFGVDQPGQLARITEMLSRHGVSVSHLRVQSGGPDPAKCDFAPSASGGGPLAENRIRIIYNAASTDTEKLRRDIQRVGEEVGYSVTCLSMDSESQFRAMTPSYVLRRKAFAVAYLQEVSAKSKVVDLVPDGSARRRVLRRRVLAAEIS
ncbi:unnamed protein product, partial [Polarella glacialis]